MTRLTLLLALSCAITLPGCRKTVPKTTETHDHEHGPETGTDCSDGLSLEGLRGLKIVDVPPPRTVTTWMPGEAVTDASGSTVLASPVKGLVKRLDVLPGQVQRAGASLALISSPELARLSAEYLAAQARLERAESELAREERLAKVGAGARRDLEQARADAATARAEASATLLGLEALGLAPGKAGATYTVKAPLTGAVLSWTVASGQGVEAGQELGRFQSAQAVRVKVDTSHPVAWPGRGTCAVRAADGRRWTARLEAGASAFAGDTRRMTHFLRLEGSSLPLPGQPVELEVPLGTGLYVPQSALQQMDGTWGVFVVEHKAACFRPVKRGADVGDQVLIQEGLKAGERLVAEGAYLLKARTLKGKHPEGEGHVH